MKLSFLIPVLLLAGCATPKQIQDVVEEKADDCKVATGEKIDRVSECLEKKGVILQSRVSWYEDYENWVKENGDVLFSRRCWIYYHPLMSSCSWLEIITNKDGLITNWEISSGFDMP